MDGLVREQHYAAEMDGTVLPYLHARRQEGRFTCPDGRELYYVHYRADRARGSVTILHGFTECAEKYRELAYFFLHAGLDVYIPEQRGHGRSFRYVADVRLTHIEHFSEYVADFTAFTEQVVAAGTAPQFLFSHSMGGAVAIRYLEQGGRLFDRAVLSCPMIAPARGGLPLWLAKAICRGAIALGGGRRQLFASRPNQRDKVFSRSNDTSRARFAYYRRVRQEDPAFQNRHPTYRWTLESLTVADAILQPGAPEQVHIPVRIYTAGQDAMVLPRPQAVLAARLPAGEQCFVPEARHEILYSTDDVLHPYLAGLLHFYFPQ